MRVYQMAFKDDYMSLWNGSNLMAFGKCGEGMLPLEQAEALDLWSESRHLASMMKARDDADAIKRFTDWVAILSRRVTV